MKVSVLLDSNDAVISAVIVDGLDYNPIQNGIIVDTDLDLNSIELEKNYKLVNNQFVELTEEEKEAFFPPEPSLVDKLANAQQQTSILSENFEQLVTYIIANIPNLPQ